MELRDCASLQSALFRKYDGKFEAMTFPRDLEASTRCRCVACSRASPNMRQMEIQGCGPCLSLIKKKTSNRCHPDTLLLLATESDSLALGDKTSYWVLNQLNSSPNSIDFNLDKRVKQGTNTPPPLPQPSNHQIIRANIAQTPPMKQAGQHR